MGQPVAIVEKPTRLPGVVRFEANRSLTGMGHEAFHSASDAVGPRPAAELARRLFATGKVDGVHIYGNMISVDVSKGHTAAGLGDTVRDLYQYWRPGMAPPAFEDLVVGDEAAAPADAAVSSGGDADSALSEAAKRVPAHLLERSRLARERWKARAAEGG
jgi:hypothetical protein